MHLVLRSTHFKTHSLKYALR